MENYEQKYKDALGWLQVLYPGLHGKTKEEAETYFPELKESEDERIRTELLIHFKCQPEHYAVRGIEVAAIIAWLEKQGEQKPVWKPTEEQ